MKNWIHSVILLSLIFTPSAFAESANQAKKGMLIGAGAGAVVGVLSSLVIVSNYGCGSNSGNESCGSTPTMVWVSAAVIGTTTLIGLGIGARIGSRYSKKQKVSLLPIIDYNRNSGATGGVLFNRQF